MQSPTHGRGASSWGPQDDHSTVWKPERSNEAMTRKRNPLACEWCYKKKIRCEVDGTNAACVQCTRRGIKCKFISRKEKREALRRTQYIKTLEDRLNRTETLLRAAGILDDATIDQEGLHGDEDGQLCSDSELEDEDDEEVFASNSPRNQEDQSSKRQDRSKPASTRPLQNSDSSNSSDLSPCKGDVQQIPLFRMDSREDSRYYGRASSLSILSREGIEWIRKKTGDTKFLNFLYSFSSRDSPLDYWRADVFHDLFACQVFKPLPSRAEVFSLVNDYFHTSNRLFPVYYEESFMQLLEWQYTQQTCNDAAWWASINIILALAYEYRISDNIKPEKDRERAWLYFKNAMSVFSELTMKRTDLLSVQALLGLALFLRGNSGTQSALPVITAAMKSCHRMGLHRDIPRPHLPRTELEQRKRVFWIAYVLDQSTCVRAGSSPAQSVDDFDVSLPEVDAENPLFFRQLCCLTIIKSRIYSKLYSAKALQRNPEEICRIVNDLHRELEEWRSENPFDNSCLQHVEGKGFLLGFASVGLQFVYYNSLIMVHRMPLLLHYYANRVGSEIQLHIDPASFADQSQVSIAVCVNAARDTLKLVNVMPWGDIAWIWSLLYYVFLAVMTLFVHILRDSKHARAREDLQSLNMAATFFSTLVPGDGPYTYAKFMTRMCTNFERIARMVMERSEKASKNRGESAEKTSQPLPRRQVAEPSQQHPTSPSIPSTNPPTNPSINNNPTIPSSDNPIPETPSTTTIFPPDTTATTNLYSTALQSSSLAPAPTPTPSSTVNSIFPPFTSAAPTTPDETNTPIPWHDIWQIPLTADWEFGLTGLFSSDYHPQYQPVYEPFLPTSTTPMSMQPPSAGQHPGYFFNAPQDPIPAQTQTQQAQGHGHSGTVWPEGYMGPF